MYKQQSIKLVTAKITWQRNAEMREGRGGKGGAILGGEALRIIKSRGQSTCLLILTKSK